MMHGQKNIKTMIEIHETFYLLNKLYT